MKIPVIVFRFAVGAIAFCSGRAFAADPETPLDEITVSATKIATPLLELPATV
ncbi:MAG TPA: hypothetical protein VGO61_02560 [Steroidobacteraceae bacterium]|jgi:hypothetical protein|nr:hypothetical protein [Steroidobacteraceae bacterium]